MSRYISEVLLVFLAFLTSCLDRLAQLLLPIFAANTEHEMLLPVGYVVLTGTSLAVAIGSTSIFRSGLRSALTFISVLAISSLFLIHLLQLNDLVFFSIILVMFTVGLVARTLHLGRIATLNELLQEEEIPRAHAFQQNGIIVGALVAPIVVPWKNLSDVEFLCAISILVVGYGWILHFVLPAKQIDAPTLSFSSLLPRDAIEPNILLCVLMTSSGLYFAALFELLDQSERLFSVVLFLQTSGQLIVGHFFASIERKARSVTIWLFVLIFIGDLVMVFGSDPLRLGAAFLGGCLFQMVFLKSNGVFQQTASKSGSISANSGRMILTFVFTNLGIILGSLLLGRIGPEKVVLISAVVSLIGVFATKHMGTENNA